MQKLKRVRILSENTSQFLLSLPKRKVQQIIKPAEDDRYYVRVDYEDDCIKIVPLEVVAEESDLQGSIEELKKQLGIGEEDVDGT